MAYFYKDGRLHAGTKEKSCDLLELTSTIGKPAYFYDLDDIRLRFEALSQALKATPHSIHYAMKANSHPAILKLFASLGAGADTVSGGEIRLALDAGIPASKIIFSGVAKTVAEIALALKAGIKQINVESPQELERIASVAARLNLTANVAFRMNPDVNPKTHPYITTGFRENKFGMDATSIPELVKILTQSKGHLRLRGLTMHIGSQLFDLDVIREAIEKTIVIHRQLVDQHGFELDRIDIGGGVGVNYETDDLEQDLEMIRSYGAMATKAVSSLGVEMLTEPGRLLVARAGLLVGEVQYVKSAPEKTFAILDTGMHHLIRPALYGAKHRILPVTLKNNPPKLYDIVGPICESADFLAKDTTLPTIEPGDRIAIADAGAYGFVMASRYNAHDLPAEIVLKDAQPLR